MPRIKVNNISLNYQEQGSGAETILFVHGLLFNHRMFSEQVDALKSDYRCISVDLRGQGESEITRSGYDMDTLTGDIGALIRALDCAPCHFVGLSMGGFIGLRLAIRNPQLLSSLSLLDTTADAEPRENLFKYHLLSYVGRVFGFRPVIGQLLSIMFAKETLESESCREMVEYWKQQLASNNRTGSVRAAMGAIKREGVSQQLASINTPTLIMVGDQDVATPVDKSERMHRGIAQSELKIIAGAGHSSCIERAEAVTGALSSFIRANSPAIMGSE